MIKKNAIIPINKYKKIKSLISLLKNLFFIFLISFFIYYIFQSPKIISAGVSNGLNICTNIIIPSLFPFMVICNFIGLSPIVNIISKILSPITKYIFNMPENVGAIIFISFVGGYPMGAKMISNFLKKEQISINIANKLLCFCINAGPAFIITAIGYIIYGSRKIGLYLLLSHFLGAILIGAILGNFSKIKKTNKTNKINLPSLKYSEAFVKSVIDGSYAIFNICSFVIIFSVITLIIKNIFNSNNFINLSLSLLEVTVGLKYIGTLNISYSLLFSSFFISFSGLSVISQILYFIKDFNLNKKVIFLFRFVHGVISSLIIYLIMLFTNNANFASLIIYDQKISFFNLSPLLSLIVFLLSLCFIIFSYSEFFDI